MLLHNIYYNQTNKYTHIFYNNCYRKRENNIYSCVCVISVYFPLFRYWINIENLVREYTHTHIHNIHNIYLVFIRGKNSILRINWMPCGDAAVYNDLSIWWWNWLEIHKHNIYMFIYAKRIEKLNKPNWIMFMWWYISVRVRVHYITYTVWWMIWNWMVV